MRTTKPDTQSANITLFKGESKQKHKENAAHTAHFFHDKPVLLLELLNSCIFCTLNMFTAIFLPQQKSPSAFVALRTRT